MNALFACEAKRFVPGFTTFRSVLGDVRLRGFWARRPRFDACLEGRFQRGAQVPHRQVVEVQAVGVAGLQGFEAQMLLGDLGEEGVDGGHGVFLSVWLA
nr:hypothetical protein [Thermomonas flagellata]